MHAELDTKWPVIVGENSPCDRQTTRASLPRIPPLAESGVLSRLSPDCRT